MTTTPKKEFKKNQFKHSKLIITESRDDAQFIYGFLKYLNESLTKTIHIHWVCGNSKLLSGNRKEDDPDGDMLGLETMTTTQDFMDNVKNIAIIFDAEENAKESFDNIIKQCRQANLISETKIKEGARAATINLPSKIGEFLPKKSILLNPNLSVFLFDNGDGVGTLEDLYLSTLEDEEKTLIQTCIEDMIKCYENKGKKVNHKKVKTQSFLAITDPKLRSIGFAATKNKIKFELGLKQEKSPLNLLKEFLLNFSKL